MTPPRPLTLLELARRAGQAAWVEARCFELVGGWVSSTAEAAIVGPLAALSHRHAWRAELWSNRVPEHTIVDAAEVTAPPSRAVVELLAGLGSLDETSVRLATLGRVVLPGLAAGYAEHLARTSPVCDGATRRVLRQVAADVEQERAAVDRLLAGLPAPRPTAVEDVEEALSAAGGILSPLP